MSKAVRDFNAWFAAFRRAEKVESARRSSGAGRSTRARDLALGAGGGKGNVGCLLVVRVRRACAKRPHASVSVSSPSPRVASGTEVPFSMRRVRVTASKDKVVGCTNVGL